MLTLAVCHKHGWAEFDIQDGGHTRGGVPRRVALCQECQKERKEAAEKGTA